MNSIQAGGYCLCGSVEYIVTGEPIWCGHCHCGSCRRQTGSAMATFVAFEKKNFKIIRGDLAMFESSVGVQRSFCGKCGTPISYQSNRIPDEIHLLLGALTHPENYTPDLHVFYREKISWLNIDDNGAHYETLPRHEST